VGYACILFDLSTAYQLNNFYKSAMKSFSMHWQSTMLGFLGVMGFSLTLPATRLALTELDPVFVGIGRAIVAAGIAGIALAIARSKRPVGLQWFRLGGSAMGVVIGFPLLATWAMTTVPAAHGAVIVGLLPLSTALFGAWLAGRIKGIALAHPLQIT
jgi:drug/metabolite transporter (DMT)-like permease